MSSSSLSSAVAPLIRQARIAAGLTQAALAEKTGCTQSAVSMFEAGKRDALSRESITKIAKLLKIDLPPEPESESAGAGAEFDINSQSFVAKVATPPSYCPDFNCPSNLAYAVGVTVFMLPTGAAGSGKHCLLCGEALSAQCPKCGAALVAFPHESLVGSVAEWVPCHNAVVEQIKATQQQ